MSTDGIILSGRLRKTNQNYIIRELNREDIFELYGLHKIILNNLKPEQQCFIHRKTPKDFVRMVDNPNQLMLGTFVDNKLIGYSSANFIDENNMDEVLPDFNLNYQADKIVVLEQASVNPQYRGNNLASIMNAARQRMAHQRGRKYAVMMVDINNYFSYRNGLRNGMCITQASVDPDDGGHIVYLSKEFGREPKFNREKHNIEVGYGDMNLNRVSTLVSNGYVASGFDDDRKKVIFNHTNSFDFKKKMINSEYTYFGLNFLKQAVGRK